MKEIDTAGLLKLKDGMLFCESDLPATPVFQKLSNAGNDDILVRPIQEDERARLGLREMDECERQSKKWNVLSLSDLPQSWELPTGEDAATVPVAPRIVHPAAIPDLSALGDSQPWQAKAGQRN